MTAIEPMPPEADFCGLIVPDQPPDDEATQTVRQQPDDDDQVPYRACPV